MNKYRTLYNEANGVKSKFAILMYLPIAFKHFNHVGYKTKFINDVRIKNKHGIFYCGNKTSSAFCVVSFMEQEMDKYFKINKGTFIDIGANIGKYSIRIGNKGNVKVIAIEPEEYNFKLLQKNIEANNLLGVIALNSGAYNYDGRKELFTESLGSGKHSLIKTNEHDDSIKINVNKVDTIVDYYNIQDLKLIKIDVEDVEDKVLEGAIKSIKRFKPKIIFESSTGKGRKSNLNKMKRLLIPLGYNIKRINIKGDYFATIKNSKPTLSTGEKE